MKLTKHLFVLLLCFSLFALFCTAVYAADGETNLYADIYVEDKELEEVVVDDEIYLEIYISDMTASGIKAGFYFDNTKLEIIDMTFEPVVFLNTKTGKYNKKASPLSETDIDLANEKGSALGVYTIPNGVDTPCQEGLLITVVFVAIDEGDATITLREEKLQAQMSYR